MLPKLLMNGMKLESIAPTQEQVAHQQNIGVNFVKCCGWINWLYFSIFWPFLRFFSLETLPKMEFKTSDNSYKPIKHHISKMGYFKCTILFNICTISFLSYYDIGCTMFKFKFTEHVYGFANFCTRKF